MRSQEKKLVELTGHYDKELKPDVDIAWQKFEKKMSPQGKVVEGNFKRWFSAAAGVAVLIAAFFFVNDSSNPIQVVQTNSDHIEKVDLPDGSEVWVNKNSTLKFSDFSENIRLVELEGAAFFDVAKDKNKQFVIKSGDLEVTVLGTAFNIRNYYFEGFQEIEVEEGSVQVSINKETHILTANEKLTFNKSGVVKNELPVENSRGWTTKSLEFDNQLLSEAILDIEQLYNVKIAVRNQELLNCFLKTSHQDEKLENILEVLELIYGCKIEEKAKNAFVLKGGSCD